MGYIIIMFYSCVASEPVSRQRLGSPSETPSLWWKGAVLALT